MELKQKWRRFWTLNRHHEDGFTLVELVVVIAILAILAGVTVPAYDDYITKAKESADQQIVAAVNTAFAAACVENKVDTVNVTEAAISVIDNKVQNLSSVTATETETSAAVDSATFNKIYTGFAFYYEGNEDAVFKNGVVNSLQWNPAVGGFEISATAVNSCILLSSGKVITISPEDMEKIRNSAYADMGYEEVAEIVNTLAASSEGLVSLAQMFKMDDRFAAVLYANGLITDVSATKGMDAAKMANGLQMVTAKYLAGATEEEIAALLKVDVGGVLGSSTGMLQNLIDGTGGTVTVSAAALQYALVESFANSSASDNTTISYKPLFGKEQKYNSVSDFLASDKAKEDPIWALNLVQNTEGYSNYTTTEQYTNDINGFVGTMSILGDNIGTTKNPGALDIDDYFANGVNSTDAKDALTEVFGK